MKKSILALAALAVGASAYAQDTAKTSEVAVTLDVTYVSSYIFRGLQAAEDSIQPSVEASYGDFYAGLWHSDDVNNNVGTVSETDIYAGYNLAINETFSADLGVYRYTYDGSSGIDTTEVYAGIKADVLLSPSAYYYYDFDREVSSYIGSIGHSLPIESVGLSLDLSATLGYVQIPGDNDYTYWGVGAAVPYSLSESATLTVAVNYTNVDERDVAVAYGAFDNDQEEIVFSVGLSVGF